MNISKGDHAVRKTDWRRQKNGVWPGVGHAHMRTMRGQMISSPLGIFALSGHAVHLSMLMLTYTMSYVAGIIP